MLISVARTLFSIAGVGCLAATQPLHHTKRAHSARVDCPGSTTQELLALHGLQAENTDGASLTISSLSEPVSTLPACHNA